MSSPRFSIRRYSYSTVFSPGTVRLMPSIEPPAGGIQYSSICARPPVAVCHAPAIHDRSESFDAEFEGANLVKDCGKAKTQAVAIIVIAMTRRSFRMIIDNFL